MKNNTYQHNSIKKILNISYPERSQSNLIELIKYQKNIKPVHKSKKQSNSSKEIPTYKEPKEEDQTFVEYILGDLYEVTDLSKYTKMTSLTLISQYLQSIDIIIENIPIKENIIFLCLNENLITNTNGLEKLPNIKEIYLSFNLITNIGKNISTLHSLTKLNLSENKITKIENLPNNSSLEELNLANNIIENIPNNKECIMQFKHIKYLNLAGNLINSFDDVFNLHTITFNNNNSHLTKLYFIDVNYGDNPLCQFNNYRTFILRLFPKLTVLDQINITKDELTQYNDIEYKLLNKYKDNIKLTYNTNEQLNHVIKSHCAFLRYVKNEQICFFDLKIKLLNYLTYERDVLYVENNLGVKELQKEISSSKEKINYCLNIINNTITNYKKITNELNVINNANIVFNSYDYETLGNVKVEIGFPNLKWTKSCIDLIKSKYALNEKMFPIKYLNVHKIFKINNKKDKIVFDSIYNALLDDNGLFGSDKKYYEFYFMIFDSTKMTKIDYLIKYAFNDLDNNEHNNNEYVLTNKLTELSFMNHTNNKDDKRYYVMVCKCINFDNLLDNVNVDSNDNNVFQSFQGVVNKMQECARESKRDIVKMYNVNTKVAYYHYKIKRMVLPEYLAEISFNKTSNQTNVHGGNCFISSYIYNKDHNVNNNNVNIISHYDNVYNECMKHLIGNTKYTLTSSNKDLFIPEIEPIIDMFNNSILCYLKNTVTTYLQSCFKYQLLDDYLNEINTIKSKIQEVLIYKFNTNFIDRVLIKDNQTQQQQQIECNGISSINLFNLNLNNKSFNDILTNIYNRSKSNESNIELLRNQCNELILSSNQLTIIDMNVILNVFPHLHKIDLSHNNISQIKYTPSDNDNNYNVKEIDLSFNDISNVNEIKCLIELFPTLERISIFGNCVNHILYTYDSNNSNLLYWNKVSDLFNVIRNYVDNNDNNNSNNKETPIQIEIDNVNIKQYDMLYRCYSSNNNNNSFNMFSNSKYFRTMLTNSQHNNNNSNNSIIILSKQNLYTIPQIKLKTQAQISILYLNLNHISKIPSHFITQFPSLTELYLQNNKLTSIVNPLPQTLTKLDLSNNNITSSLSAISTLTNLKWLNISYNRICSLKDINTLPKLNELYINNNQLSHIKECYILKDLPSLQILNINDNEVLLKEKNLKEMMIFYCESLRYYNNELISSNEREQIKEIYTGKLTYGILDKRIPEGFNSHTVTQLNLSDLKLKEEINIFNKQLFPLLEVLNLSKNNFKTFSIFNSLPCLHELNLSYNNFTTITNKNDKRVIKSISSLPNLHVLDLSNNTISNANGVHYFKNIKKLILKRNSLTKIDFMNNMDGLLYLDVSNNKLRLIDRIIYNKAKEPLLEVLIVDNNCIKTITNFAVFAQLMYLSCENNKVQDLISIDQIPTLKKLKELNLSQNPIMKIIDYRKRMIKLFSHNHNLSKLDKIEITNEEKQFVFSDTFHSSTINIHNSNITSNGSSCNNSNNNTNLKSCINVLGNNCITSIKIPSRINSATYTTSPNGVNSNNSYSNYRNIKKRSNNLITNLRYDLLTTTTNSNHTLYKHTGNNNMNNVHSSNKSVNGKLNLLTSGPAINSNVIRRNNVNINTNNNNNNKDTSKDYGYCYLQNRKSTSNDYKKRTKGYSNSTGNSIVTIATSNNDKTHKVNEEAQQSKNAVCVSSNIKYTIKK